MSGKKLQFWAGIGISLLCLLFLLRQMDMVKLVAAFSAMDWRLIPLAVLITFISYFFRAIRWGALLKPMKSVPLPSLYAATIIGYMANNILPARLGELARAHLLARREGLPTSSVFATLVVDRLWDGFTVLGMLVLTLMTLRLPPEMAGVQHSLEVGGYLMTGIYLAALLVLFLLKQQTALARRLIGFFCSPFPVAWGEKLLSMMETFLSGLRPGSRQGIVLIFLTSIMIWGTALWPVDLVLRSFGIALPVAGSMLILVFLVFAVMVPASPGYIGTYHLACVYGLKAFALEGEQAMSIAIVMHGLNFFPVIIAGTCCLVAQKLSLSSLSETDDLEIEQKDQI